MSEMKIKNQKIIKVGNSYALTLDKEFFDRAKLQEGSEMIANYDEETASVTFATPVTYAASQKHRPLQVAEKTAVYAGKITKELEEWTTSFIKENAQALKELANL